MEIPPFPLISSFLKKLHLEELQPREKLIAIARSVSEIPWGEGRTIEEVLETKHVGTCTGKHLVLQSCLNAIGLPWRPVVCTFRWSEQGLALPSGLTAILQEGKWDHGHNFVQCRREDGQWIDLDVTWDPPLRIVGFRALPHNWNGAGSFLGLSRIVKRWDGVDMQMKKGELIAHLSPPQREQRRQFLSALIRWIASLRRV